RRRGNSPGPGQRRVRLVRGTCTPLVAAIPPHYAAGKRLPMSARQAAIERRRGCADEAKKSAGVAPGAFVSCEYRPRPALDQKTWRIPTPKPLTSEPGASGTLLSAPVRMPKVPLSSLRVVPKWAYRLVRLDIGCT